MSLALVAPAPHVPRQDFRNAMAGLAAAVNIITSDGPHGRVGFTATAVCSVTDDPPTLLVCLNRSASVHPVLTANAVLCVNTLAGDQRELSNLFGGKTPMAERFAAGAWRTGDNGAPLLEGAAAGFECRISRTVDVGTHDVLFCEVLALKRDDQASALVYFDRNYHGLSTC
ncbi:MAG: pyrimidine utilization flavin reductase protein F [Pseudomonas sp.]|uniref:NADH-dependent FMN reductase RutF n=1 Tax=Pseudomonas abieticivorans TaxID=2931382 RepID=UPI0020BE638C|nr:pyrimidine utilization flavin reductase protein F [Pseudomonas sp. PIA16]MDE1167832.1 pyrimidine utilization flavin reductase protein F [Pseudomonas sp.]